MSASLPPGFAALEPFVADWVCASADERARQRRESTSAEREAFFAAMKDQAPGALDLLDAKPLDQFDAAEQRLMQLILSFAHVSLAVEVQGADEPKHARSSQYLKITRAPADLR